MTQKAQANEEAKSSRGQGRPRICKGGNSVLGAKVPNDYRDEFIRLADEKFNIPHSELLRTLVFSFVEYQRSLTHNG